MEGDDYTGLYRDVLIDTPVGVYFIRFLEESFEGIGENRTMNDIQALFKEMKPEFIRTSLKRMWLEDMYQFVRTKFSGESLEVMLDLINFEADFKTLQVILF
jgi:V-type H+-transporting ATPase subunit d